MKDGLALLGCGVMFSMLAWASWHWWPDIISFAVLVIVLLGYVVDNYRLRQQIKTLLAERDRRKR